MLFQTPSEKQEWELGTHFLLDVFRFLVGRIRNSRPDREILFLILVPVDIIKNLKHQ